MNDFGVDIDPKDINGLFKAFDYENDGTINFNEFIRVVVGPMNAFRTKICGRAFQQIDYNGDGTLSLEDIKGSYNASFHPDVKAGKENRRSGIDRMAHDLRKSLQYDHWRTK